MSNEIVTIHFHGGTKAVATIEHADLADEQVRVEQLNKQLQQDWNTEIGCAEELVESALTVPPRPGWRWIGDAFVFTQAVSGIEYGACI